MNSAEAESFLLNIDEAVFVDGKIVTYCSLSKTLGIHTNLSKQLLHTFFEKCLRKKDLCATYLLIGCPIGEETCKVSIVKDKDLPEAEKSLKSISSKHIYSVQKCLELADINVLYTAQKEDLVDEISKGVSSIDFNCNLRDSALITKLKLNALPAVSKQSTGITKKITPQPTKQSKSPIKNGKSVVNCCKSDKSKECDSKAESKKALIPSMFKTSVESKKKPTEKAPVNSKKASGIGAFFSKTSKPVNEAKATTDNNSVKEEKTHDSKVEERLSPLKKNKPTLNVCKEKKTNPELPQDTPNPLLKSQKTNIKSKTTSKKESSKAGKKKSGKKPEKEQKKRKRLQVLSDDSESDNSEEEEMVREPTPEPQPTIISDHEDADDIVYGTPEPRSRKRKKLVTKTYQASDGYMVTEKMFVEESCSEEEETVPEKKFKDDTAEESAMKKPNDSGSETKSEKLPLKDKKESPKTKAKSPQKTKQASLMSFFKKK